MNTARFAACAFVWALGVAAAIAAGGRQAEPGVLLRAAIQKEDVAGDLEGAMALYRQIVTEHGQDRPAAAKALLRLGGCYEKLGRSEAKKAYQQLISDYADQAAEVAAARQKLAGLALASTARPSEPVFQKITIPGKIPGGARLASDGARLVMVSEGDLWVVSLRGQVAREIAGTPRRLSNGANASWAGLALSGDGQWIAFNEQRMPSRDMYVLPASGGAPRKLPRPAPILGGGPWWLGLAPDGRQLAYSVQADGGNIVHVVAVDSGQTVARLGMPEASEPAFSPDGSRVAYIREREKKSGRELRVVRLADGSDVQIAEAATTATRPASLRSPAWSPDGSLVAYLLSRGRDEADFMHRADVYITPVAKAGETAHSPTKIALPRFGLSIAGWAADGRIGLLCLSPLRSAIYTVPSAGGKATQVTPESDFVFLPQWSPDGGRIYFRWQQGDIAFVPAGGGRITPVPRSGVQVTEALPGGGNHVSPDGKTIVFAGAVQGTSQLRLWTMPVAGGEPVKLRMQPELDAFQPRWSPDGKWIAFESERSVPGDRKLDENIFIVSSEGGEPRQLTHHTDCFCELMAWSPGGDSIAYACGDETIRVVPFAGGTPRTVLKVSGLSSHSGSLEWTRDGARILYVAKGRLWSVPAAGGEPAAIGTDVGGDIEQFALSPDGRTIAFNVPSGGDIELWMMESFMHLVKAPR